MRSDYVSRIRSRIGHDLLLLPAVTAVIRDGDRFLLVRQQDSEEWGLVGGAIEPREEPKDAVIREVLEEIGIRPDVSRMLGAYGGDDLVVTYPNGDVVGYTTISFECTLPPGSKIIFADGELVEAAWFTLADLRGKRTYPGVERMLRDAGDAPAVTPADGGAS